jgi:hypothetical protein
MPLLIDRDGQTTTFVRKSLKSSSYDEKWLQQLLFERPELLTMETGERGIIPICRELPLKGSGSTVFLDLFCVRDDGKPVLVECKLWRNPQARREVIGQILEYASLLRGLTFSDLEAIVGPKLSGNTRNPIFAVAQSLKPTLLEKEFVDACHGYLSRGEFELIIAGDGIRSGITGIKELLESRGGLASRLRLVEIDIFESEQGDILVQAAVQAKTRTVQVTIGSSGETLVPEADLIDESVPSIGGKPSAWKKQSIQFWQRFVEELHLDHPDQQPAKRHGSWNARLPFPSPGKYIGVWREKSENTLGVYLCCNDSDEGRVFYRSLVDDLVALEEEIDHALIHDDHSSYNTTPFIMLKNMDFVVDDKAQEIAQLDFLKKYANRFVNVFRRRLPKTN